jgi:hypothetical protein
MSMTSGVVADTKNIEHDCHVVKILVTFLLVITAALAVSSSLPVKAQEPSSKPNIVFILTDDMRTDDLDVMTKTRALLPIAKVFSSLCR